MQHKLHGGIVILNTYIVNTMWLIFFNRLKNPSEQIWIHLKLFVVKSEVWEPSGKGVLGGVIPHAHLFSFLIDSKMIHLSEISLISGKNSYVKIQKLEYFESVQIQFVNLREEF